MNEYDSPSFFVRLENLEVTLFASLVLENVFIRRLKTI